MAKLSLRDVDVGGKRVLVRVDFNVPIDERDGKIDITDDTRIRESLPTINYLREHHAKTILMSHLGRPKGGPEPQYSLGPVAARLSELLGRKVVFASDCIGAPAELVAPIARQRRRHGGSGRDQVDVQGIQPESADGNEGR